jgi:uncharacterized damage-inducible protein DinB
MPKPDPAIAPYLTLLADAYETKAWHGPNLRGSLRGLKAREAAWRAAPGRHNAWELALHAAYWKYAVRRLLTGEKRGSFPFAGSNWFARPVGEASEKAFKADLAVLAEQHRLLVRAVAGLRRRDLEGKPPGSQYTRARLVQGAAAHDLYHTGQIQLLKRLRA